MAEWSDRLNRFVDALQAGKRPDRGLATTSEEVEDLRLAARLAGARPGAADPDPAFLSRLRDELHVGAPRRTPRVSRSRLIRGAGLWLTGLAAGIGLDVARRQYRPSAGPAPRPRGELGLAGGRWYSVGALGQIPDGSVMAFDAGPIPTFVLREGATVWALSRVCTHMGCLLKYDANERELDCPCHGAVFDLNGKPSPEYDAFALPPLPSLDVRVDNGTVYVLGA